MAVSAPNPVSGGVAPVALFALAYGGAIALGNLFTFDSASVAAFWPASGILLAALLIAPAAHWVRFVAAGFLVQVGIGVGFHDRSLGMAAAMATAQCIEALVAAYAVQRAIGAPVVLSKIRHLLLFIGLAAVAAPMLGATVIAVATPDPAVWPLWPVRWAADALGVLIVAPLILAVAGRPLPASALPGTASRFETAALYISTALAIQATIGTGSAAIPLLGQFPSIVFPLLIWAALRFDQRHVSGVLFVVALLLIWNGDQGRGPFTGLPLEASRQVFSLQSFLAVAAVTTLILSAIVLDRHRKQAALEESESLLRDVLDTSSDWFWETGDDFRFTRFSPIKGEADQEHFPDAIGKTRWAHAEADPEQDGLWRAHRQALLARKPFRNFQYRVTDPQGASVYWSASGLPVFDRSGSFQGYRGTVADVTAEAVAKERAGRAEQRLLDAIEGISDSFALYDSQQRLVLANRAFRKLHRCQPGELAEGMHRRDLLRLIAERGAIPEAIGRVEAFVEERMRISKDRKVPFEQEFADGRWMLVGEHPTSEGGLVTWHADVTDLKATEAALLKRGLELDQAQRIGRIGHWHWDLDTGALERSDELFRLIGLDPHGPAPSEEEANDLVHPDDRETYLTRHNDAAARGEPMSIDYRCVLANGEIRHFHEESRPQRDESGRVRSVFGITQDITEQKTAEDALRDREQQLTVIVDAINTAGFGLSLQDANYAIVEINQAAVEMAGFDDRSDLIGNRWIGLADPDDQDYMAKAQQLREGIEHEGVSQVELRWKRHDAQSPPIDVVVTAVRAEDRGTVSIFSDVTEQRRVEREQKRLEQDLQQSQKMEALGQLAGGTAHEINNLLQPILTFTKLVQDGLSDPVQREFLDRVLDASRKAKAIVRDILLFSRKGPRQLETMDVNAALRDAIRFVRGVTLNSVDFVLRIPDKEARARINSTEFTQVIMNLVQNAADAMPARAGQITITSRTVSLKESQAARLGLGPGSYLRCIVQDDGQGMSPETLDHIFEPFFTTKPPGRGTGLGLAVVYGIVTSWNGTIRAASSPGVGARFSVYIPILAD